jgi:hypothetical protein
MSDPAVVVGALLVGTVASMIAEKLSRNAPTLPTLLAIYVAIAGSVGIASYIVTPSERAIAVGIGIGSAPGVLAICIVCIVQARAPGRTP